MKLLQSFIFFLISISTVVAQETKINLQILVVDSLNNSSIPFTKIEAVGNKQNIIEYADHKGRCTLLLTPERYNLRVRAMGFHPINLNVELKQDTVITTKLGTISSELNEVVVVGRKRAIKIKPDRIQYDFAADPIAKSLNLFAALPRVPLVNIDQDGSITIKGKSAYAIYINGRPLPVTKTNPKSFLQSITGEKVKKIEIIETAKSPYVSETSEMVINIIMSSNDFNDYTICLNGGAATQPKGNFGGNLMGRFRQMDFFLGYDYNVNIQNKQPIEFNSEFDSKKEGRIRSFSSGIGDGNWGKHLIRGMFLWNLDSLRSFYIDLHRQIEQTDLTTKWEQTLMEKPGNLPLQTFFYSTNKNTFGTTEGNILYQQLSPKTQNEQWSFGYRYTYTPDVRKFYQTLQGEGLENKHYTDATNGGLQEHSIASNLTFIETNTTILKIGVKQIFRIGKIENNKENAAQERLQPSIDPPKTLNYNQSLSSIQGSYMGNYGFWDINASLKWEYYKGKTISSETQKDILSRETHYIMPYINLSYNLGKMSYSLTYQGIVLRPAITMINPFKALLSQYSSTMGNPGIRDSYLHMIEGSYSLYTNTFFLSHGIAYKRTYFPVEQISWYDDSKKQLISQYQNMNLRHGVYSNVYISYRPFSWLSFAFSGDIDIYANIQENEHKRSWKSAYNTTIMSDFILGKNWLIGIQWGQYKNIPALSSKIHPFSVSSISLRKSFLGGRLNISVVANTLNKRYNQLTTETYLPNFKGIQRNFMTGRSIGVDVSYIFNKGKSKRIDRNNSLRNSDLKTGVE